MKNCNNPDGSIGAVIGCLVGGSLSDLLFAYRKETARVLKLSNRNHELNLREAFDKLKNIKLLTSDEADNLHRCALETISARAGRANIKRTLTFLQNTSAKALINGNRNGLYLDYINLCIGLVREVDNETELPPNVQAAQAATATLPAGSGAAILTGAAVGGFIGGSIGGGVGAAIGAAVGALVGSSNDIEVTTTPQPQ
ncbi:hypothetical protein [Maribacter sp. 2210JD10-5]|uniref:hypothetical protein n=1 Tax=Maribacter sp. 2210JD10-5 TaxID=3386272 RepID=UPI0039BD190F